MNTTYANHPERFSHDCPIVHIPSTEVYINKVLTNIDQLTIEKGANFPALQRMIGKIS